MCKCLNVSLYFFLINSATVHAMTILGAFWYCFYLKFSTLSVQEEPIFKMREISSTSSYCLQVSRTKILKQLFQFLNTVLLYIYG